MRVLQQTDFLKCEKARRQVKISKLIERAQPSRIDKARKAVVINSKG